MPQEIVEKVAEGILTADDPDLWQHAPELMKDQSRVEARSALAALSPDDLKGLLEHATGKRVVLLSEEEIEPLLSLIGPTHERVFDKSQPAQRLHTAKAKLRSALASPRELGQDDG